MKKLYSFFALAMMLSLALPANAQLVSGPRGYDDFKIGVAGYTYRSYDIDQTLAFLKSMEVNYFSVKDWWLPLDSTKEQMDAFKAKCREAGVECSICGQAGSDPKFVKWLVNQGISSVSSNIDAIPKIRETVAKTERQILLNMAFKKN
jgi:pyruvate,water dikinase